MFMLMYVFQAWCVPIANTKACHLTKGVIRGKHVATEISYALPKSNVKESKSKLRNCNYLDTCISKMQITDKEEL